MEGNPGIEIRQPSPHELAAVRTLRQEGLHGDQPLPEPVQPTDADLDPSNLHMAAFAGEQVVGAVRVDPLPEPPDTHHVSRMVTRVEHRGKGIGAQVLRAAETAATERGARRFTLNSRPEAEGFYVKAGYTRSAEQLDPEHIVMEKQADN
jgi:predicted GNAT family N-acyltransferase